MVGWLDHRPPAGIGGGLDGVDSGDILVPRAKQALAIPMTIGLVLDGSYGIGLKGVVSQMIWT
jgi:hypothetical protein